MFSSIFIPPFHLPIILWMIWHGCLVLNLVEICNGYNMLGGKLSSPICNNLLGYPVHDKYFSMEKFFHSLFYFHQEGLCFHPLCNVVCENNDIGVLSGWRINRSYGIEGSFLKRLYYNLLCL
jgi:hypothetical protein